MGSLLLFATFLFCQVLGKDLEFPAILNETGIEVPDEYGYTTEDTLKPAHNRDDSTRLLRKPVAMINATLSGLELPDRDKNPTHFLTNKILEEEFHDYFSETNGTVTSSRRKRNVKVDNIYNKLKKHLVNLNGKNCNLKTQDLNYILDVETTGSLEFICKNRNKLIVIGKHVSFKSFVSKTCEDKLKYIELFATDTLVIDDDLVKTGDELHLSIVAKRWEIKGNRKIILDGAPAKRLNIPEQAAKGNCSGCKGEDGQSGLPGGNAGNFFGIGSSFVNGNSLVISAHGGDGSAGQHGGDGIDGANGKDAALPNSPSSFYNGLETSEFQYSKTGKQVLVPSIIYFMRYTFHGTTGSKGGTGGNGGDGGKGGKAGEIKICELDNYSGIVRQAYKGKMGLAGKGGDGGHAGRSGSDIQADIQFEQRIRTYEIIDKWENILVVQKDNEFDGNGGWNGGYGPDHFPGRGGGHRPWQGHRFGHGGYGPPHFPRQGHGGYGPLHFPRQGHDAYGPRHFPRQGHRLGHNHGGWERHS